MLVFILQEVYSPFHQPNYSQRRESHGKGYFIYSTVSEGS
jgi:hypothetical protein